MKKMPYEIKRKLMMLAKANEKIRNLTTEVNCMIGEYGVDIGRLDATTTIHPYTEAMGYIINAEHSCDEDIIESVKQIEEVFLYIVNNEM